MWQDLGVRNGMSVAFPAVVAEDEGSGKEQPLKIKYTPKFQIQDGFLRNF